VQENLSEAVEKLASRLVRQWGEELRRSISEELQPVLEAEITRAGHEAAFVIASDLVRLLQAANQVEILSVLLQTTQPFAARAGLLILRGGFFMGWQSRGMRDASAFTRISIPASDRVLERLGKERQPMRLQAAEIGDAFASAAPAGPGDIYLFPLLIRDPPGGNRLCRRRSDGLGGSGRGGAGHELNCLHRGGNGFVAQTSRVGRDAVGTAGNKSGAGAALTGSGGCTARTASSGYSGGRSRGCGAARRSRGTDLRRRRAAGDGISGYVSK
jgi:hypothetical protein